jgi:hypothetical protein
MNEERFQPFSLGDDVGGERNGSGDREGLRRALRNAPTASIASFADKGVSGIREKVDAVRADIGARPATCASIAEEEEFWGVALRLRAVAPSTAQRTTFQVHGHADAGPVMYRKGVCIENKTWRVGSGGDSHCAWPSCRRM